MTTAQCAKHMNTLAGERLYSARYVRSCIEKGHIEADNPFRDPRERAIITTDAFAEYLKRRHPDLYRKWRSAA